jgi:hypothetical protein
MKFSLFLVYVAFGERGPLYLVYRKILPLYKPLYVAQITPRQNVLQSGEFILFI